MYATHKELRYLDDRTHLLTVKLMYMDENCTFLLECTVDKNLRQTWSQNDLDQYGRLFPYYRILLCNYDKYFTLIEITVPD